MHKVYLAIPGRDEGRKQMASDPAEDSNPDGESRGSPQVLALVLRNILLIPLEIWKKLAGG